MDIVKYYNLCSNGQEVTDSYIRLLLQKTFESFRFIKNTLNQDRVLFFDMNIYLNEYNFIYTQYMVDVEKRVISNSRFIRKYSNMGEYDDSVYDIVTVFVDCMNDTVEDIDNVTFDILRYIFRLTRSFIPLSAEHIAVLYMYDNIVDSDVINNNNIKNNILDNILFIRTVLYKLKFLGYDVLSDDEDYDNCENISCEIDAMVNSYEKLEQIIDTILNYVNSVLNTDVYKEGEYRESVRFVIFSYSTLLYRNYDLDIFLEKMYRYSVDNVYEFNSFITGITNCVRHLIMPDIKE